MQGKKLDFYLCSALGMEPPQSHRATGAGQFPSRDRRWQQQELPLRCWSRSWRGRSRQPSSGHCLGCLLHPAVPCGDSGTAETQTPRTTLATSTRGSGRAGGSAESSLNPHYLQATSGHRITLPCTTQGALSPDVTAGCQHWSGSKPRGVFGTAPAAASPSWRAGTPALAGEMRSPRTGCGDGPLGQGSHIMVHRFLRRAPWKRMVVWTCLQRAQPTLLRSSLKSRRMCQLYLAEHSM